MKGSQFFPFRDCGDLDIFSPELCFTGREMEEGWQCPCWQTEGGACAPLTEIRLRVFPWDERGHTEHAPARALFVEHALRVALLDRSSRTAFNTGMGFEGLCQVTISLEIPRNPIKSDTRCLLRLDTWSDRWSSSRTSHVEIIVPMTWS